MDPEQFASVKADDELLLYRLSRLEEAVEKNNSSAVARDENIIIELKAVSAISSRVTLLEFRAETLATKFDRVIQYVAGLSFVLLGVVLTFAVSFLK